MIKTLEDLHKKAVVEKCFLENQVVVDVSTAFGSKEDVKKLSDELVRLFKIEPLTVYPIDLEVFLIIGSGGSATAIKCPNPNYIGGGLYERNHIPYTLVDNNFNVVKMFEQHPKKYNEWIIKIHEPPKRLGGLTK